MSSYQTIRLKTDTARTDTRIAAPGRYFLAVYVPEGINAKIRFGEHSSQELDLESGMEHRSDEGWPAIVITHDALSGNEMQLYVSATDRLTLPSSSTNQQTTYVPGNPYIATIDLPTANTDVDTSVHAQLGRNAHRGFVRAPTGNTGTVQLAISYDGTTFSGYMGELLPGESMSLDGLDVHTIRAQSDVAGDDIIIEAH